MLLTSHGVIIPIQDGCDYRNHTIIMRFVALHGIVHVSEIFREA